MITQSSFLEKTAARNFLAAATAVRIDCAPAVGVIGSRFGPRRNRRYFAAEPSGEVAPEAGQCFEYRGLIGGGSGLPFLCGELQWRTQQENGDGTCWEDFVD
jgi:hypothetical protein